MKRFKEVILEAKLRVPQLLNPEKLNSIPDDASLVIQAAKNAIEVLNCDHMTHYRLLTYIVLPLELKFLGTTTM